MNKKIKLDIIISTIIIIILIILSISSIIIYKKIISKNENKYSTVYVDVSYRNNGKSINDDLIYKIKNDNIIYKTFGKMIEKEIPEKYDSIPFEFYDYGFGNVIVSYKSIGNSINDWTFLYKNKENYYQSTLGIDSTNFKWNHFQIKEN